MAQTEREPKHGLHLLLCWHLPSKFMELSKLLYPLLLDSLRIRKCQIWWSHCLICNHLPIYRSIDWASLVAQQ